MISPLPFWALLFLLAYPLLERVALAIWHQRRKR
jgi:hypothetical protein